MSSCSLSWKSISDFDQFVEVRTVRKKVTRSSKLASKLKRKKIMDIIKEWILHEKVTKTHTDQPINE